MVFLSQDLVERSSFLLASQDNQHTCNNVSYGGESAWFSKQQGDSGAAPAGLTNSLHFNREHSSAKAWHSIHSVPTTTLKSIYQPISIFCASLCGQFLLPCSSDLLSCDVAHGVRASTNLNNIVAKHLYCNHNVISIF